MARILTFIVFLIVHLHIWGRPTHHLESPPKITVVGAGLAGLTAAYRLQKMGHSCDVYEARSRPGGRVFTAYFGTEYEELGAVNLYDGGSGKNILALIDELGLGTEEYLGQLMLPMDLESRIDLFSRAPEPTEYNLNALKEKTSSAKSLADLLDPFFAGIATVRRGMETWMNSWEGSPTNRLASEYVEESFWRMYQMYYAHLNPNPQSTPIKPAIRKVAGGNSRLVAALADPLQERIHYEHPLRKISRSADGKIWLHFDDTSVGTDYLILAIPCSTLRDVVIEEGIVPDDQQLAIDTLQYGTNAKMLFPVSCSDSFQISWVPIDDWHFFFNKRHTILTLFWPDNSGHFNPGSEIFCKAVERDTSRLTQILPDVSFLKGVKATSHKKFLFSQYDQPVAVSWVNEEFSKGSYSNYGVGTFAFFNTFIDDYGESVRKVFRSIDGRIFFAGEHTAPKGDNGTMDGAVNSGERAVRLLLRSFESFHYGQISDGSVPIEKLSLDSVWSQAAASSDSRREEL